MDLSGDKLKELKDLPKKGQENVARQAFKELGSYLELLLRAEDLDAVRKIAKEANTVYKQYGSAVYHSSGKHPSK